MSPAAITVRNVSKTFRVPLDHSSTLKYRMVHWRSAGRFAKFDALHDVSFDVPKGEFLGIIGSNGSGKSTLLKILSRIYQPTSGTVTIRGRVSPFLELGVGFNPELTARENIYLNGAVLGLTRAEIEARIEDIIDFSGPQIRAAAEQKVKNYSSGMQVRLAFSVAIQADADVLLMDEVLAVGDAEFQAKCFDVFARYRRQGKTVILVTHDLGSVEQYCDRAILIEAGCMVADGPAGEVTSRYRRAVGLARSEVSSTVAQDLNEAPHEEGETPKEREAKRWGSGEMEIAEVALLDGKGTQTRNFTSDQPLTVRIRYRTVVDVGEFTCGVAFHRADGLPIAGNNTYISGLRLQCPPAGESGEIRYVIPSLSLLRGGYRLSVDLHARHSSYPYDHHDQAHEFDVNDESCRWAFVELGGRWEVEGRVDQAAPMTQADLMRLAAEEAGKTRETASPPGANSDANPAEDGATTAVS